MAHKQDRDKIEKEAEQPLLPPPDALPVGDHGLDPNDPAHPLNLLKARQQSVGTRDTFEGNPRRPDDPQPRVTRSTVELAQEFDKHKKGGKQATAKELHAHLIETGTPEAKLAPILPFVQSSPDTPATVLYETLESLGSEINPGTLEKAGKFVFGPTFRPNDTAVLSANDEIQRQRQEIEMLRGRLAEEAAQKVGLTAQVMELREQLNATTRKSQASQAAAQANEPKSRSKHHEG